MYDNLQNDYYATSSQLESLSSGTTNPDDGLIVVFLTQSEIEAINNKTYTTTTNVGVDLLTARQTSTWNRYYICYVQGHKVYIVGRTDYNTGWYNLIGTTDDPTLGRHVYISRSGTSDRYYITVDQSSSGQTSAWRIVHNANHEVQWQSTIDTDKVSWLFDTVNNYSMEI